MELNTKNSGKPAAATQTAKTRRSSTSSVRDDSVATKPTLNAAELKKKFPKRPTTMERDEKLMRAPVDEFSWVINSPKEMQFDEGRLPEFEVLDDNKVKHEWLTRALQPCFHYSQALHSAFLSIHKPPVGFQYRIQWYVPEAAKTTKPEQGPDIAKAMRFANGPVFFFALAVGVHRWLGVE